ncbi:MAG: S8/S53 family peptidase [Acidothermus sp.]|nr:S8/S53 family peptidase [Acidothermus sp.]
MRFDYVARNERLLSRHPDIQAIEGPRGLVFLRRDEVLAAASHADRVADQGRRWIEAQQAHPSGVVRFRLRSAARVDVLEWTDTLTGSAHKNAVIGPNHVLLAQPQWHPGPADDPEPADNPIPPYDVVLPPNAPQVKIAVLDTGIVAHPWFVSRPWFSSCTQDDYEVLDANLDFYLDSVAGHGTFIAGVIRQWAPAADLVISRVVESDGTTDEFRLIQTLHTLPAVDIISLSLGCYTHDDKPPAVLTHILARIPQTTLIVACAGNTASDRPFWPAATKRVIGVAALNAAGTDRAVFSNYGWWVDACAVGENLVSSFVTFDGPRPPHGGRDPDRFIGYARWSGTSFAAPRVAAAIARRAYEQAIPIRQAAAQLLDPTAHRYFPDLGVVVDPPPGIPSAHVGAVGGSG